MHARIDVHGAVDAGGGAERAASRGARVGAIARPFARRRGPSTRALAPRIQHIVGAAVAAEGRAG